MILGEAKPCHVPIPPVIVGISHPGYFFFRPESSWATCRTVLDGVK